jgi:hypothetical protein
MSFSDVILAIFAVAGGLMMAAVLALVIARVMLRNKLRLHPTRRSTVPTTWLASPRAQARAHRRLRAATVRARYEVASLASVHSDDPAQMVDVVEQLHQRAYDLEHRLVSSTRAPKATRHTVMAHTMAGIVDLERRVELLSGAASAWRQTMAEPVGYDDRQLAYDAGYDAGIANRLDEVAERIQSVRATPSN